LRAGIVEALFTRDERALALVSKEAQARKLPLLRARLGLLRARLGLAPDPEREIAGAWETLLREDASCLRADAFLARTQARVAFALVPVEEGSSSAPSMSSALKGMPVALVDAQAVALLRSSACVVWFEEGGILLAFDPDKETTFRLETRTGTLLDALLRTLLEAQGTGCTLAKLHSCRSVVPFRAESHAATLHVALARLRARILPCGLHVAHDARTGRYRIASERRFFRHVRHWASERSDSGTRDRQARALGTSDAFAARQKEILTLLENETFASTARLCEALGVTRQSLRPYLDALAREGVLHRWGKGPATRYALSP
jgi:hypothetical protein